MRLIDADELKKCKVYSEERHEFIVAVFNIDNAPTVECDNCDYRKFTEKFINGVVEVMNKNGITSVEQLSEILKGAGK